MCTQVLHRSFKKYWPVFLSVMVNRHPMKKRDENKSRMKSAISSSIIVRVNIYIVKIFPFSQSAIDKLGNERLESRPTERMTELCEFEGTSERR